MTLSDATHIAERIAGTIALLSVAGSAVFFAYDSHKTQIEVRASAHAVTDAVVRPCGGGHPCGTLATVNKVAVKIGDAVVTTQLQERRATAHATALMDTTNGTIGKVGKLAEQGTELAHNTSGLALSAQADTDALRPALVAATGTVGDLGTLAKSMNARVNDPRVGTIMVNLADFTQNANGIAANFKATTGMVNHYLQPILAPKPCPKKGHLGCEIRRHLWPTIKGTAQFGQSIYWARSNF